MPMGLNISPSIWQSYINVILDCLQSRKYCKAIMCYAMIELTPIGLKHPVVTSQSQARGGRYAIPACSCKLDNW